MKEWPVCVEEKREMSAKGVMHSKGLSFGGMSVESTETMDSYEALKTEVPWKAYCTAKLITPRELGLIEQYDKQTQEIQDTLLQQDGPAYVDAFMAVLRNTSKEQARFGVLNAEWDSLFGLMGFGSFCVGHFGCTG